jgi:myo-inositol-1(or 4)-monophosphatase
LPAADNDLAADLALLLDVAQEAGDLAVEWLEKGAASWDKSPGNPVTEADIAVNDLIALRLGQARSDYGWLSEETKDDPANRDSARTFVVDPIDGTRAFVRGEPGFCISIARLQGPDPAVGVLYNPLTHEMFDAAAGMGARLNGQLISASRTAAFGGSSLILQPHAQARLNVKEHWPDIRLMPTPPNSIAYRIALVACGRWDAAIGINYTNDWDVAAAALVLTEAGGAISDGTGRRLAFNRADPRHPGVVAAGANLHPLLVDRLRNLDMPA